MTRKNLHDEGTENRAKGVGKEIEGKVRNAVGALTGDESEQVKGKAKETGGKIQQKAGEIQEDVAKSRGNRY